MIRPGEGRVLFTPVRNTSSSIELPEHVQLGAHSKLMLLSDQTVFPHHDGPVFVALDPEAFRAGRVASINVDGQPSVYSARDTDVAAYYIEGEKP